MNATIIAVFNNLCRNEITFFILRHSCRRHIIWKKGTLAELPLAGIRCHSLLFVVPLVVPLVIPRCHSLHHLLSLVAIRCPALVPFVNDPIKLGISLCGFVNSSESKDSKYEIIYINVSPRFNCLFSINKNISVNSW